MSPSAKILVADADAVACSKCQTLLVGDGHEVNVALTGDEALRKIEEDRFDVVLLDLRIRRCGGLSLLRAIRKSSPETEVVVVTDAPSIENAKESIRLGAFEFVTKPLGPQALRNVVDLAIACRPWAIQQRC